MGKGYQRIEFQRNLYLQQGLDRVAQESVRHLPAGNVIAVGKRQIRTVFGGAGGQMGFGH